MKKLIILSLLFLLTPSFVDASSNLTTRLRGYILLQVEEHGEAWYVEPESDKRYYLRDGEVAYEALRKFGLGITDADLAKIPVGLEERFKDLDSDGDGLPNQLEEGLKTDPFKYDIDGDGVSDGDEVLKNNTNPLSAGKLYYNYSLVNRLKGRIVLQVQSLGQAWYINPKDGKRYYMKDGNAAYQIMRFLSLGITNKDLEDIDIGLLTLELPSLPKLPSYITAEDKDNLSKLINSSPKINKTIYLTDYKDKMYSVSVDIPLDYYLYYKNKTHDMGENYENITAFITPDDYFINLLLQQINDFNMKAIADQTPMIINSLEEIVQNNYYIEDWHSGYDEYPKYPIETIFEGNGDCEDLSFLLATLLKSTSDNIYYGIRAPYYSVALIKFSDHLAVGLSYEDSETRTAEENFNYIRSIAPEINGYYEYNNKKYFYIESTNFEFDFGEIPVELLNKNVNIYPLLYNKPQI